MTGGRKALVLVLLACLTMPAAWGMHRGVDFWPISFYPMFSRVRERAHLDHLALTALPADGSAAFPLFRSEMIHPYGWYRQRRGLRELLDGPGGVPAVRVGLADVARRYEQNRRAGRHGGPPLSGIRLERVDYDLDPAAEGLVRRVERAEVTELRVQGAGHGG